MKLEDLDYDLPESLIAQEPAHRREDARLLVVDRASGSISDDVFKNIGNHLREGDCLVLNDTRVIRARLRARKRTGGNVELFLLHESAPGEWEALIRPSSKVKPGAAVAIGQQLEAVVGEVLPNGRRLVRFPVPDVVSLLEAEGEIPLPPYIKREAPREIDAVRYQTTFARRPGAVAAPTAGLHYTPELLAELEARGIHRVFVTLHVGYGTFRPIQTEHIEDHVVESEDYEISAQTAAKLNEVKRNGGRVVSVGTTSARALETSDSDGRIRSGAGATRLYIYPPFQFRAVDVLQTNFHLPRSSLLALVAAFAGRELVLEAYRHAVEAKYRFYSYGDTMLIL